MSNDPRVIVALVPLAGTSPPVAGKVQELLLELQSTFLTTSYTTGSGQRPE